MPRPHLLRPRRQPPPNSRNPFHSAFIASEMAKCSRLSPTVLLVAGAYVLVSAVERAKPARPDVFTVVMPSSFTVITSLRSTHSTRDLIDPEPFRKYRGS